ncbi:hypothetical protein [Oxynema sp. CENA135]|uniref:hypothetical protein n=1 Tax=Oxynema sp. CENA135 TaxID=984206 RepID=UPI001F383336|nr:hypothetical protein [Oxynema sp. CENA135]
MQVDRHFPNLWQLDYEAIDGIVLELGKHKGFELTEFFETRESISPFLKDFPGIVQSTNRSLQHLRMHLTQVRELLLCFGQVVLLTMVRREWLIGANDVFLFQRASVYLTLTRSNPVFEFA